MKNLDLELLSYQILGNIAKMAAANPAIKLDPKYDDYDYPVTAPHAQNGHPGHTTEQQDAQVFQLRSMLEQAGYTERLDTLSLVGYLGDNKHYTPLTDSVVAFP